MVKTSKVSVVGTLSTGAVGIFIGVFLPWQGELSVMGHLALMILLITVGLWVFKPFGLPFSLSSMFMMAAFIVIGIPMSQVFSGFTSGAIWTLIPALLFGHVILKTGLGKRIALILLKQFNPSYKNLILIFSIIGIILSVLTPSITVRVSILLPIALSCIDVCDIKGNSKEGALILLSSLIVAIIPGTGWLTGSLYGPVTLGMYESVPELKGVITFNSWAMVNLLPALLLTVLVVAGGYFIFKPKSRLNLSKETFKDKYKALGGTSLEEKRAVVILVLSFLLFLTGGFGLHQLPGPAIMLGAVFLLALTGVIKQADVSVGVNWDIVVFMGAAMGLIGIFAEIGVANWMAGILIPVLTPISGSPWLFVYGVVLVLFVWRFFDIATLVPTKAILIPALPLISQELGINPLIWVPIFVMVGNSFFLSYTNGFVLVGQSIVGERGWTNQQVNRFGLVYGVACLVAIALSIPYWIMMGIL